MGSEVDGSKILRRGMSESWWVRLEERKILYAMDEGGVPETNTTRGSSLVGRESRVSPKTSSSEVDSSEVNVRDGLLTRGGVVADRSRGREKYRE